MSDPDTAMPYVSFSPAISEACTVAPEAVLSPIVPLPLAGCRPSLCPTRGAPGWKHAACPMPRSCARHGTGRSRNEGWEPHRRITRRCVSVLRRSADRCRRLHPLRGDLRLHRLLQLLERPHLDLPHPLTRDIVFLRQILERRRIVLQPALFEDVAFPRVQRLQRGRQQGLAPAEFLLLADRAFLAFRLVDQPVLPFTLTVGPHRGVQ